MSFLLTEENISAYRNSHVTWQKSKFAPDSQKIIVGILVSSLICPECQRTEARRYTVGGNHYL